MFWRTEEEKKRRRSQREWLREQNRQLTSGGEPDWTVTPSEAPEKIKTADGAALELQGRLLAITRSGKLAGRDIDSTVTATVDTAGNLSHRPTLTRTAAGALIANVPGAIVGLAARKKVDTRELYLLVEAAGWTEAFKLKPQDGEAARRIAQKINLAARQSK